MNVVVVGDLMVDVVAAHDEPLAIGSDTAARTLLQGGGAGGNVAAWLADAGVDVALVGRVGDDALAEVALRGLDSVDLRLTRVASERTGLCVVLVGPDGERTMLPDAGANAGLVEDDLPPELFVSGGVLYVSGYTLLRDRSRGAAQVALRRARESGMKTVVDAASAAPLRGFPGFVVAAGDVDLMFANADEAVVLGPDHRARELVVKYGSAGATWTEGMTTISHAAAVTQAIDTTGAGDAFAAGFLSAWPGPPEPALAAGAALAARAVGVAGARPDR